MIPSTSLTMRVKPPHQSVTTSGIEDRVDAPARLPVICFILLYWVVDVKGGHAQIREETITEVLCEVVIGSPRDKLIGPRHGDAGGLRVRSFCRSEHPMVDWTPTIIQSECSGTVPAPLPTVYHTDSQHAPSESRALTAQPSFSNAFWGGHKGHSSANGLKTRSDPRVAAASFLRECILRQLRELAGSFPSPAPHRQPDGPSGSGSALLCCAMQKKRRHIVIAEELNADGGGFELECGER